jgi:hypothetical protein
MATATTMLRAVNHDLRARLGRLHGGAGRPPAIALTEFTDLLAQLLRARDYLRNQGSPPAEPELAQEISQYRSHLETLVAVLPSISGRLLAEKARLEAARAHVSKAAAWARAGAKTF